MSIHTFSLRKLGILINSQFIGGCSVDNNTKPFPQVSRLLETTQKFKVKVPDLLHFIWIGECSKADFSYLPIWQFCNTDKQLVLWTDGSSAQYHIFQSCLRDWCCSHPQYLLNELQNNAFHFIYPRIIAGETFNDAAMMFLASCDIPIETTIYEAPAPATQVENIVYQNIQTLFTEDMESYRKLYYYELILRGNPAAASDIIRLIVLYRYGGIYIDLDTLPDISALFPLTREVEVSLNMMDNEIICLAKSAAFLEWFEDGNDPVFRADHFLRQLTVLSEDDRIQLYSSVLSDVHGIQPSQLNSLGCIRVYQDAILAGAVNFLPGTYFNNLLAAAPGSRVVRLILKNIRKRYSFLEKNNAIFSSPPPDEQNSYSQILHNYRQPHCTFSDPTTRWLTGPGAIIDTVIALAYRLLPKLDDIPPHKLGVILQDDIFGLTIKHQTLDTPMGLK